MKRENRLLKIAGIYKESQIEPSGFLQTPNPVVTNYGTREDAVKKKELQVPPESSKYPTPGENQPKVDVKKPETMGPLSTRSSPDRPGQGAIRVSDGVVADPITGKIYDYSQGFKREDGSVVPGGSVSLQTKVGY
jgi:hypothetical protein